MENKQTKPEKVLSVVCIISVIMLIIGILMLPFSQVDAKEYSTEEYWVSSKYNHVYEISTGEIVNLITEDEKCEIKHDLVIVKTINYKMRKTAFILIIVSLLVIGPITVEKIKRSGWWDRFLSTFE